MKYIALWLTIAFAVSIGDEAELLNFMNARSSANFQKSTQNVVQQLDAGTKGIVRDVQLLPSGNSAIFIEVTVPAHTPALKYWIYYNKQLQRIKFTAADGAPTAEAQRAHTAEVMRPVPSVRDDQASAMVAVAAAPIESADFSAHPSVDVIYVGDSHSYGCFGETVEKSLREQKDPSTNKPIRVRSAALCGTSASNWIDDANATFEQKRLKRINDTECGIRVCDFANQCMRSKKGNGPSLKAILDESHAKKKIAIIELGSNMLHASMAHTDATVRQLIAETKKSGASCIWIGPPQAKTRVGYPESKSWPLPIEKYDAFVRELEKTVTESGCKFIHSDDKTSRDNISDPMGLHYDCPIVRKGKVISTSDWAIRWGQKVIPELTNDLNEELTSGHSPAAAQTGQNTQTRK